MRLAQLSWDWMLGWTKIPSHLRADIDELREDPVERLADAPVVIRRFRTWPFIILTPILVYGTVALVRSELHNVSWPAMVFAGIALLLMIAYVRFMPDELRLEHDGILIRRRRLEIVCSWELFAAVGHPFRAGGWLVLPANPLAVDLVGMWRRGKIVAEGQAVRTGFFKFAAPDQVQLTTGLELGPHLLGELLLHVAATMCEPVESGVANLPAAEHASEGTHTAQANQTERDVPASLPVAVIDWGGRLRVPCTRLLFPPECCICGQSTSSTLPLRAPGRLGVLPTRSCVDFKLPCCPRCARSEVRRSWVALVLPALLNAAAWIVLLFLVTEWSSTNWLKALGLGSLASLSTLWLAMTVGGWLLGRVSATFQSYRSELELRFRRIEYPRRVVEYLASLQAEMASGVDVELRLRDSTPARRSNPD